jgi:hypothetical protein
MGTAPNLTDVEDGLDQVGNLESAVEPMPTFTSVNPAPCRVGPPHLGFYRSSSSQSNQKVAPQRALQPARGHTMSTANYSADIAQDD